MPERDAAIAAGRDVPLKPAKLARAASVGGLGVEIHELPPGDTGARPGRLATALLGAPIWVVAAAAARPLVVARRRLRDTGQGAVERLVVSPELGARTVLVDIAEVEKAVGAGLPDRRREAAGSRSGGSGVTHRPHFGALGSRLSTRRRNRGRDRHRQRERCHGSTNTPLLTARSPVGSDGRFTTSPRTVIVVDPPPSKLSASRAPSARVTRAASASVTPALHPGRRPSTVTKRIRPSRRTPASVRGFRDATNEPKKLGASSGAKPSARAATAVRPRTRRRGPALTTSSCRSTAISRRPARSAS